MEFRTQVLRMVYEHQTGHIGGDFVEVPAGPLGHGVAIGVGMALAA